MSQIVPQSVVFLQDESYYHTLLDLFLATAKFNCNSYFELRVQNSVLRHKLSDTERPGTSFAFKPTFTRLPPQQPARHTAPTATAAGQQTPPKRPNKRRCAAVISPSGQSQPLHNESSNVRSTTVMSVPRTAHINNELAGDPPEVVRQHDNVQRNLEVSESAGDPPEVVRQYDNVQHNLEVSDLSIDYPNDDDNVANLTYVSDYTTPNRFSILSGYEDGDDPTPRLEDTSANKSRISVPPCELSHKCFTCRQECESDCDITFTPGPMYMRCIICRKQFTNHESVEKENPFPSIYQKRCSPHNFVEPCYSCGPDAKYF